MSDNAERDENRVTTIIGVSKIDYVTPVTVAIDVVSHGVIVEVA